LVHEGNRQPLRVAAAFDSSQTLVCKYKAAVLFQQEQNEEHKQDRQTDGHPHGSIERTRVADARNIPGELIVMCNVVDMQSEVAPE
jgi:hypothetical protein